MGYDGTKLSLRDERPWPVAACDPCGHPICSLRPDDGPAPRQRDLERGASLDIAASFKVWTVVEGLVALCTALPDGRRQIVSLSTPGELICPMVGAKGADVWVEALAASRLCEIDLSSRIGAIKDDAALSAELFRVVHRQVMCSSVHMVTLGRLDGMERVCLFLTDMVWRLGIPTAGGWRVQLPLSREDIADYLGLNAETVSRILSRVKKAKLATFLSPTELLVKDVEALQSRAPLAAPHGPEWLGNCRPKALS